MPRRQNPPGEREDLLEFYRKQVDGFDAERSEILKKLKNLEPDNAELHSLRWQLHSRDEEIARLQTAIAASDMIVAEERSKCLSLARIIDSVLGTDQCGDPSDVFRACKERMDVTPQDEVVADLLSQQRRREADIEAWHQKQDARLQELTEQLAAAECQKEMSIKAELALKAECHRLKCDLAEMADALRDQEKRLASTQQHLEREQAENISPSLLKDYHRRERCAIEALKDVRRQLEESENLRQQERRQAECAVATQRARLAQTRRVAERQVAELFHQADDMRRRIEDLEECDGIEVVPG